MSPIPQLPVTSAPPPAKATATRVEPKKSDSPQEQSDGSFATVLSNALPEEKASTDIPVGASESDAGETQPTAGSDGKEEASVVTTVQPSEHEVKRPRTSLMAQVESVDIVASSYEAAPSEETTGAVDEPGGAPPVKGGESARPVAIEAEDVELQPVRAITTEAEIDGPTPETTAPEPERKLPQETSRPQAAIADVARDEQAAAPAPTVDEPDAAKTEIVEDADRAVARMAPPVNVQRPINPVADDTKQAVAIPVGEASKPARAQSDMPQVVDAPKVAALRLDTGREGQPPIAVEDDPVVQLATRIDGDAKSNDERTPEVALTKSPVEKSAEVRVDAERVLARQTIRVAEGEAKPTREALAAATSSTGRPAARLDSKTDLAAKPINEMESVVLAQGNELEPDNDGEPQNGPRELVKPERTANLAVPPSEIEKVVAEPVAAKPQPARMVITTTPVGSVPVQAVADVAGRPVVPMAQPVADAAPPSAPLAEEPALNAQIQQQASRTTLNVVMHDDRMGRVALQLIERGGWVETAIRTSDPRGAQVLSNATAGLIETLQQRGVTAMAAGGSAAWDAQEGQRRDNPHRDQDPQRRRLRVRRQGQEFIGALAQAAS